jgi:hypothetical protein
VIGAEVIDVIDVGSRGPASGGAHPARGLRLRARLRVLHIADTAAVCGAMLRRVMRSLPRLAIALAIGCYTPTVQPGGACTTWCPGGLECVEGLCVLPGSGGGGDGPLAVDAAGDTGGADSGGSDSGVEIDPTLVAHWKLDDAPADGALDSSGRGHHAACTSCPMLVPGKLGMGYRFDRTLRHILKVPDHPDFRGPYTIAAWIRPSATTEQIALLSKPYGNNTGNSWQLEVLDTDRVSLSGGDPHTLASPAAVSPDAWHHVAGTWDGTTKRLFIGGAQVAAQAATVAYDGHDVYLGGDQNSGNEVLHWDGVLDDLRVYSRALSAAEIAALAALAEIAALAQ